jgi:heme oxygenase (biliverdin-IX-beta and delta-forming)
MILAELKEQTRKQHENLESIVDVMNKMFTRDDYETLLTKFYRFYSAVEPKVAANDMPANGIDVAERTKLKWLEHDLISLGAFDRAKQLPALSNTPVLDTPAKAFGAMYVMEGATLGGQVITRHLKQHLDLTPETGGAFFNSYGQRVGPMWKAFGAAITSFAETNGNNGEIVQAAKDTFDSFARCFSESTEPAEALA